MNERKKIEDRIKKKEEEIQYLEGQSRDARVYLKALQDVLKMLPRETESHAETLTQLRSGSSAEKARNIIRKKGKPVHISDLLHEMGRVLTRESRASLSSSLAAYARKGEIFCRSGPNMFGLIEMGHTGKNERDNEPPENFGEFEEF